MSKMNRKKRIQYDTTQKGSFIQFMAFCVIMFRLYIVVITYSAALIAFCIRKFIYHFKKKKNSFFRLEDRHHSEKCTHAICVLFIILSIDQYHHDMFEFFFFQLFIIYGLINFETVYRKLKR